MASKAQIEAVEVYTTTEPCMSKSLQYKGLVLASKVKSRNMFSDIGSGFKSLVGGEVKGLSKLTSDVKDELLCSFPRTPQHSTPFFEGWRPTPCLRSTP